MFSLLSCSTSESNLQGQSHPDQVYMNIQQGIPAPFVRQLQVSVYSYIHITMLAGESIERVPAIDRFEMGLMHVMLRATHWRR